MNILVVDDDAASRNYVGRFLEELGHQVVTCDSAEQAAEKVLDKSFPMVLTDIRMPGMSGLELLQTIKDSPALNRTSVVLFTGYGDMGSAVAALRAGAYDYLHKPVNIDELVAVTNRIAVLNELFGENQQLSTHLKTTKYQLQQNQSDMIPLKALALQAAGINSICAVSQAMQDVVTKAAAYHRDLSIPVLIQGETGVGKEKVARLIHFGKQGENLSRPFVDINCAAITPNLFESELFGHEANSFTNAAAKGQQGKMDIAAGGTLLLDEVTELSLEFQSKLLRVIETQEYYRVGGLKKVRLNARVICTTNADIDELTKSGRFRQDLLYRLRVGNIFVPPLRERREDIVPLALTFMTGANRRWEKNFLRIHPEAAQLLIQHQWPGNIRELRHLIEQVVFFNGGEEVRLMHIRDALEKKLVEPSAATDGLEQELLLSDDSGGLLKADGFDLEAHTKAIILKAYEKCGRNQAETARYLKLSRRVLSYQLHQILDNNGEG